MLLGAAVPESEPGTGSTLDRKAAWEVRAACRNACLRGEEHAREEGRGRGNEGSSGCETAFFVSGTLFYDKLESCEGCFCCWQEARPTTRLWLLDLVYM